MLQDQQKHEHFQLRSSAGASGESEGVAVGACASRSSEIRSICRGVFLILLTNFEWSSLIGVEKSVRQRHPFVWTDLVAALSREAKLAALVDSAPDCSVQQPPPGAHIRLPPFESRTVSHVRRRASVN